MSYALFVLFAILGLFLLACLSPIIAVFASVLHSLLISL